ncbi:hypothetical protein KC19_8G074500 [Ceratodon purpureus]|uniref:Uncharacterized protein n=1 Tax=Ceratodon purpureus TaxID=3225 RepID=A0A8T0GWE2_CERPU|nr:hypothetical protein KC19_8G074500 [Ceratodon purpureus]
MESSTSKKTNPTIAIASFMIVGFLVIVAVQIFCSVPEQQLAAIFTNNTDGKICNPALNSITGENLTEAENLTAAKSSAATAELWFPTRHWTRQSKLSPVVNAERPGANQMMYGTLEVQHAIWNHQHPSSCEDKKFLLYEAIGNGHGIGSVIHVTSAALLAALNMDRILVLSPQPHNNWVNGRFCEGMDTIDECYFEPLSSCTIFDVLGDMEYSDENLNKFMEFNQEVYVNSSERVLRTGIKRINRVQTVPILNRDTPHMFYDLLKRGGIPVDFYYWWRAQSTAYIVRPTLRTLRELDRRRGVIFQGQAIEPGTISVHVRHGDKWKEGKLENDTTFFRTAEALLNLNVPGTSGLQRKIYLSTEDPETVRFFSSQRDWTVVYTNVSRDAYKDPTVSPMNFAERIGWDEEFLNSLLSLQLAVECDGFVGAISSNWNRLIDELRSTVRRKYDRVFIDVVQGLNVTDYEW